MKYYASVSKHFIQNCLIVCEIDRLMIRKQRKVLKIKLVFTFKSNIFNVSFTRYVATTPDEFHQNFTGLNEQNSLREVII